MPVWTFSEFYVVIATAIKTGFSSQSPTLTKRPYCNQIQSQYVVKFGLSQPMCSQLLTNGPLCLKRKRYSESCDSTLIWSQNQSSSKVGKPHELETLVSLPPETT